MKTITTLLILFCSFNICSAQKAELSKEETVKYINDLYMKSLNQTGNVILDGKTLVISFDNKIISREYLMVTQPLKVTEHDGKHYIRDQKEEVVLLWGIPVENDAQRLKNALEHLIEILKAEPETDPFAN